MAIERVRHATWLDEVGMRLGMPRLKNETLRGYRKRLLEHARDLPESTQKSFVRTVGRLLGGVEFDAFTIEPVTTYDSTTGLYSLAVPDPYIEVDSAFLRVYQNYAADPDTPDLELNIWERGEHYFLKDVYDELATLSYLTVTPASTPVATSDWAYLKASNLTYGNNIRHVHGKGLQPVRMNDLPYQYIREISFDNQLVFKDEQDAHSNLLEDSAVQGDYFVDYVKGVVFSVTEATGIYFLTYLDFPYKLKWQDVRTVPMNDASIDYVLKDDLIGTSGEEEKLLLNSYGAAIVNDILSVHSLQWGE